MAKRAIQPDSAGVNENGDNLIFGNLDEKHQHPFPENWATSVVVKQYGLLTNAGGQPQIDNSTIRVMPYDLANFAALSKNDNAGFGDLNYVIVHDPR